MSADTNETAADLLRRNIPPSMKGLGWNQLIATLATSEQYLWSQSQAVYDELFLASAHGSYLDARASAAGGFRRAEQVGMDDRVFRDLIVQLSTQKLTLNAFLGVLELYYGPEAVRAHVDAVQGPYSILDTESQAFLLDGRTAVTVTFSAADFRNIEQATATEVAVALNRGFFLADARALALPVVDPQTGIGYVSVLSPTRGLRGSIEVVYGPVPFPAGRQTIQNQTQAAYAKRSAETVEVLLPATSAVVNRDSGTATYLTPSDETEVLQDGDGPYLHDPHTNIAISETATTLMTRLEAGNSYRAVQVSDYSGFPDAPGWVVFGFGFDYQTEPVRYLGTGGLNALLVDPSHRFTQDVPADASVTLVERTADDQTPGGDGDFWLTSSQSGRVVCGQDLQTIASGAIDLMLTVLYPGDVGLGNAGFPTCGQPRLTDAVMVWGGDNLDEELAAARADVRSRSRVARARGTGSTLMAPREPGSMPGVLDQPLDMLLG